MNYKAVGFDYGGVIGGVGTTGGAFTEKACKLLGVDKEQYRVIYFSLNSKINLGEITSWREFWALFLEKLGQPEQLEGLMKLSDETQKHLRKIEPVMVELVDEVRAAGYKTGLLSNTTLEGGADMRQQGLDRHFDVFDISAETKLMKPQPEAFKHFADDLGVGMTELIFIDDAEKSLSTAKECGFTPILFKSPDEIRKQLQSFGILP
jgi:HAD superfamily hydrolase (TIGR01509 family)